MNENKQTENFLDTDRIPTMEELREHFRTHDFTTTAVYDEDELTDEMKVEIAYVSSLFNAQWDKLAKEKGLRDHVSCYSDNNPLIALRNNFGRVVSENVHKLIEEYPEQAEKIIEQYAYVFEQPEKADEFLKKVLIRLWRSCNLKTV